MSEKDKAAGKHGLDRGHLCALITIFIWGTTFISTKVLLISFNAVEIMFFRLLLAYFILLLIKPRFIKYKNLKEEGMFIAAGVCGVTLFFLFQNIALTYTLASNVSVLISVAPFFTAILSHFFLKSEELHINFFAGFAVSIIGIILIGFNGNFILKLNPIGDILALLSAVVWAVYSILLKKISENGYNTIQCTRKIFFYGLISLIPALKLFDVRLDLYRFTSISNTLNIIYLSLGASAVCYVTWNYAVSVLGPVKTSVYIYVIPVITIAMSAIILNERITLVSVIGVMLILLGLYLSEKKSKQSSLSLEA